MINNSSIFVSPLGKDFSGYGFYILELPPPRPPPANLPSEPT